MSLPDWNENGKRDAFDAFVDMNIIEEAINEKEKLNNPDNDRRVTGISMGGKPLYDATKDSDGMIILKTFSVVAILIAGIAIPVHYGMGQLGVLIGMFLSLGISMTILKNT